MPPAEYRLSHVIALMRHAAMSSSYKPALLVAIVRCLSKTEWRTTTMPLSMLAASYLDMYWTQVVVFRLRHSSRDSAPPLIVQHILAASARLKARKIDDLPSSERESLTDLIAKVLPINVLDAFHNSKPAEMPRLYEWHSPQANITLDGRAVDFIKAHSAALTLIGNYYWARFLSRLNAAPYIIDKVERLKPARSSLVKYARLLRDLGERSCFYCRRQISDVDQAAVDHFIPWTFAFEDKLWNLVMACRPCNSAKSDQLADDAILDRLIALNKIRSSSPLVKPASQLALQQPDPTLVHLYRTARNEEWPVWLMPGKVTEQDVGS